MQAYETGLKGGDTRLVLSPNSDFFRYFNDAQGRTGGSFPNGVTPNRQGAGAPAPAAPAPAAPPAPPAQ
jgi:membrane protease subunit HflC